MTNRLNEIWKWTPRPGLNILFPYWWKYVFAKPTGYDKRLTFQKIWCRMCSHPNGQIYFNPNGLEPDNRCKDCGDEIA